MTNEGAFYTIFFDFCMVFLILYCALVDWKKRMIPNRVLAAGGVVSISAMTIYYAQGAPVSAIVERWTAASVLFGIFFSICMLTDSFGAGDAKMAAMMGLYFGKTSIRILSVSFLVAGLYSICRALFQKKTSAIPLAPFFGLATVLELVFALVTFKGLM